MDYGNGPSHDWLYCYDFENDCRFVNKLYKILSYQNGGSASECQYLAGELVGRLMGNLRSFAALALGADSAAMSFYCNLGTSKFLRAELRNWGAQAMYYLAFPPAASPVKWYLRFKLLMRLASIL